MDEAIRCVIHVHISRHHAEDWLAGDMVYLDVMGQPILILGSLERTEDMMEKYATTYSDRPSLPAGQLYGLTGSLANSLHVLTHSLQHRPDLQLCNEELRARVAPRPPSIPPIP
jgi:hypothetical protein